ncbi:MAG: hypothetical protein CVT94_18460 [Bacteroidetes bacterium HGW-Bacteroidetes-11]|nr:MAG: hypothetical protein CVT94_18460 [Bacteroidetes bacterium HGW-Bacteroidetes-11]
MLQAALFLSWVHLKRYWRILGELGIFRAGFLIAISTAGIVATSKPGFLTFQSVLLVFSLAGIHNQRNDRVLLSNLGLNKPLFFQLMYGLFLAPFAVFYMASVKYIPLLILLSGIFITSYQNKQIRLKFSRKSIIGFSFLPAIAWEWKSGLRRTWWMIAGIIILSLIFRNQMIVLIVSMVLISLMVAEYQMYHEQRLMIQALQKSPSGFLLRKTGLQLTFYTLTCLPLILTAVILFPDSYRVIVLVLVSSLLVQICAVLFKYSAYVQGEKTPFFMSLLVLLNLSFIFPPISPLPLIIIVIFYNKAIIRLKTVNYADNT